MGKWGYDVRDARKQISKNEINNWLKNKINNWSKNEINN
jgi:hypothetical protein